MSMTATLHEISPRLMQELLDAADPGPTIDAVVAYRPGQPEPKTDVDVLIGLLTPAQRRALDSPEMRAHFERQASRSSLQSPEMQEYLARRRGRRVDAADLGEVLDLEKAWHGVHFLACGAADAAPPPLGDAVLGGAPVGPDRGYGPARILTPDRVGAVAGALAALPERAVAARVDPAALRRAKIYPRGWSREDRREWLLTSLRSMEGFYRAAAGRRNAVLLALS